MQHLHEGDRVPDAAVQVLRDDGWEPARVEHLFAGRTIVAFAVPGAFTPTCSSQHLPRFEELAPALRARGVDDVLCIAVNDPYVMQAWAHEQGVDNVTLVADGNCEFTDALGMGVDRRDLGFGRRSWRYSLLAHDGVIEKMFVEPEEPGDPYRVSDADTMLAWLDPQAKPPDEVAILTRPGCPHCARAKQMLEEASLDYVELPLENKVRGRVVAAITGHHTVPQIFINGEAIGGADALEHRLYGPGGRPETRTA